MAHLEGMALTMATYRPWYFVPFMLVVMGGGVAFWVWFFFWFLGGGPDDKGYF